MHILYIGKRHYTNKDTLTEKFGRIYKLPFIWSTLAACNVDLWLIDYHTKSHVYQQDNLLNVRSTPIGRFSFFVTLFRYLFHNRTSTIVASGDSYIGMLGWLIAKLKRATFVLDVYDKYDEFEGYRKFFGFSPFEFLLKRSENFFFASSKLAHEISCRHTINYRIVENGVDTNTFYQMDKLDCRNTLGLNSERIYVGYCGSMEPDRGISDLISAVELLNQKELDITLLIAGKKHGSIMLETTPFILYLGILPHNQVPSFINACDVVVVPYRISPFMDSGASCKIAEYLACQTPIVSTRTPNLLSNFRQQAEQLGDRLCEPESPPDMARAIQLQLVKPVTTDLPRNFFWTYIAVNTLNWLKGLH